MTTPFTTIIINPHARQGRAAQVLPWMQAYLAQQSIGLPAATVVSCSTPQALSELFAQLPCGSRVIGVGGDGTNHRLLPYLLAGQHEYGLVPYGSGDDVARAVGLFGKPWQVALQHALTAPAKGIDVAVATNLDANAMAEKQRYFLGCFLFGLDGHINNQTSTWKFKGALPYFLTLLKELPRLRGWQVQSAWRDALGQTQHSDMHAQVLCSVLNTPTYGSGYPIAPGARMDDGLLNFMQAPMVGRVKFLNLFFKMLKGQHLQDGTVQMHQVSEVRIESPHALCLSADGEVIDWQTKAVEIKVLPAALPMVVGY